MKEPGPENPLDRAVSAGFSGSLYGFRTRFIDRAGRGWLDFRKVEKNQRLFIYDRKEMLVLLLLGVMVAFFAFTLGVHLGKKVVVRSGNGAAVTAGHEATGVATTGDATPGKQDFQDAMKGATPPVVDETVNQALHEEVERTGLRLEQGKQISLPSTTRSESKPATVEHKAEHKAEPSQHAPATRTEAKVEKTAAPVAHSKAHHYALQIGSYPSEADARARMLTLSSKGLKPYVHSAEVKGAHWFRVFVGSYDSKDEAEKVGARMKGDHLIEDFVISRIAKSAE